MYIKATPVDLKDLKPGDLFTEGDVAYWNDMEARKAIGEIVFIRTNTKLPPSEDPSQRIFKVEIVNGTEEETFDVEQLKQKLGAKETY